MSVYERHRPYASSYEQKYMLRQHCAWQPDRRLPLIEEQNYFRKLLFLPEEGKSETVPMIENTTHELDIIEFQVNRMLVFNSPLNAVKMY